MALDADEIDLLVTLTKGYSVADLVNLSRAATRIS
jgi:hypothetical protein